VATVDNFEAELDAIRIKLYEETKHMTPEEHTRWTNERGQKLAAEFGFTIGEEKRRKG
jgi:hypothetical protein